MDVHDLGLNARQRGLYPTWITWLLQSWSCHVDGYLHIFISLCIIHTNGDGNVLLATWKQIWWLLFFYQRLLTWYIAAVWFCTFLNVHFCFICLFCVYLFYFSINFLYKIPKTGIRQSCSFEEIVCNISLD